MRWSPQLATIRRSWSQEPETYGHVEMVTPDGDVWPSERWSPEMTLVYDLKWLQEPETYGHLRWSSEQGYQSQLKWSHMPEPMDIWAWSCELEAGGHQRWSPEPELYELFENGHTSRRYAVA